MRPRRASRLVPAARSGALYAARVPHRPFIALLAALCILALAAPALAEPGEPPIALLAPGDGERVAANLDGIPVSFACPPTAAEPPFGTDTAYGADLATSAALAPSGRLADAVGSGVPRPRAGDPSTCDAQLGGGGAPRPQITPGTYYWQAWRYCDACASGYETSEVRRFAIGLAGSVRLGAPKRAYKGYAVVFAVEPSVDGVYDEEGVQRRAGGAWRTIATRRGGAVIARLPRGRQVLRAFVRSGGDTITSAARTVKVAKARKWRTGRRDDGAYRDAQRPSVRLKVSGKGRRITGLRADITADCVDLNAPGGISPGSRRAEFPPLRVAPDGRIAFYGRYRGAEVTLVARLGKRRLRATTLRYSDSACAGSIAVDARRR